MEKPRVKVKRDAIDKRIAQYEEKLDYLREQHSKMTKPSITIFTTKSGRSYTRKGDLLVGKGFKYMRLHDDAADLLGFEHGDYLLLGGFGRSGKTVFMAKRPKGMFGGILLERGKATKTLHSTTQALIKPIEEDGFREGGYNIDYDEEPVEEFYDGNKVTWYRLKDV